VAHLVAGRRQEPARTEQYTPEGVTVETVARFGAIGNVQTCSMATNVTKSVTTTRIVGLEPRVDWWTEVDL